MSESVQRVATLATVRAWRLLLELPGLAGIALLTVRGALVDPESHGLERCAEVTGLLIDVDELLARRYGSAAGALPQSPLAVPDDPGELI